MNCTRCQGLMVVDHFIDLHDDTSHLWLRAWRCVNCGDVVDPAIRHNQMRQTNGRPPAPDRKLAITQLRRLGVA